MINRQIALSQWQCNSTCRSHTGSAPTAVSAKSPARPQLCLEGPLALPRAHVGGGDGLVRFRAPGEVHTLTVADDCEKLQTFFAILGPVHYIDDDKVVHVEDNVGLFNLCKEANGLGEDFVDQCVR